MSQPEELRSIASALREAGRVVVLTGAGVSAESGIPTFRDAMDGLWAKYDPSDLATPEAFGRDPETVTRWYDERRLKCLKCHPNPAHAALAEMQGLVEERGGSFALLTQNVDRLHQRAGSRSVVELHGSLMVWRCTESGQEIEPQAEPLARFPMPSPFAQGALLRPGVVWFGEMLPEAALEASQQALESCDLFLSVGTSAVVQPAAGFVHIASRAGAQTAEINRESTAISRWVDWSVMGNAGEILPDLIRLARHE